MGLLAVSVVGADRPGIVAAVTGVLYRHGFNLEDTSSTILRGHFAMMLVVAGPLPAAGLEAELAPVAAPLDLVVSVREITPEPSPPQPRHPYVASVYGADHPGIVHRVAAFLAEQGVNVTDLTTRLVGETETPLYMMLLELDLPEDVDANGLGRALEELAGELEVEATLRPVDADIL